MYTRIRERYNVVQTLGFGVGGGGWLINLIDVFFFIAITYTEYPATFILDPYLLQSFKHSEINCFVESPTLMIPTAI